MTAELDPEIKLDARARESAPPLASEASHLVEAMRRAGVTRIPVGQRLVLALEHVAPLTFPTALRPSPTSFAALASQSLIQTKRILTKWARDPMTTIQALLYPALTLVMLWIVLGDSISRATGTDALDGLVPMSVLVGSMAGAVAGAITLMREREEGLVARFAALPNHRAAPIVGRILADSVRVLTTTIVLIMTGWLIGYRFTQGAWSVIGMALVPLLFGIGYSTMATAAAISTTKRTFVEFLSLATTVLMFFNTGFVPLAAYPGWLQSPVRYQPMSCAIEAMKGLANGGPVAEPLAWTIGWSVLLMSVFAVPAVRGYRRAAASRH